MKRRQPSDAAERTASTRALEVPPTRPLPREKRAPERGARGFEPVDLVLDRYRLERRLGAGGFGVVWLAYDVRLEREVALKVVAHDSGTRAPIRAEREALVAARFNHPGIVALYEFGSDDEAVYIVSELVRGRTLAELEHECALSDRDVARIGVALCEALAHAHEREVVHRDIKPHNVMVVAEPAAGAGFAKLADFGVAHLASGDRLTRTGDVVGTLAYMAPEQAEGIQVTPAADTYSLALTLYEAWTGSNPVRGPAPAATARRLGLPLPPLASKRGDLPAGLCETIDAALDPDPELRPSVGALRAALERAEPSLSDEGGLVEPETLERLGLARSRALPTELPGVVSRAGAGLATGALVFAAFEQLGPSPEASSLALGTACAVLVALLPRIGWIASALAICGWLAFGVDREGTALVLAVALTPVPLLLPRAGPLWSVPALAPLLGVIGLATLFVALAGLASTAWRRAGLAVAGFLWLAVAEIISGEALLFGIADGTAARPNWDQSVTDAAADALYPLVSSPALAPLAIWAVFAAVLPFAVRGRSLVIDCAGAALWAAGLTICMAAAGDLVAASGELPEARGATAGAVLGAVSAIVAAGLGLAPRPNREPTASSVGWRAPE